MFETTNVEYLRCGACKKDFHLSIPNGDLRQVRMADDKYEVFYSCPHCKYKYHVCFLNKELVAMQREMYEISKSKGRKSPDFKILVASYSEKLADFNMKMSKPADVKNCV
jgi:hypothetical protein